MKLTNPSLSCTKNLQVKIGEYNKQATAENPAAPEGYSDAYMRDHFMRTSFHLKKGPNSNPEDSDFSIQISNITWPDESSDTDWVPLTSTFSDYVCTDLLFRWFRVKGVAEGDTVYVCSFDPKFA